MSRHVRKKRENSASRHIGKESELALPRPSPPYGAGMNGWLHRQTSRRRCDGSPRASFCWGLLGGATCGSPGPCSKGCSGGPASRSQVKRVLERVSALVPHRGRWLSLRRSILRPYLPAVPNAAPPVQSRRGSWRMAFECGTRPKRQRPEKALDGPFAVASHSLLRSCSRERPSGLALGRSAGKAGVCGLSSAGVLSALFSGCLRAERSAGQGGDTGPRQAAWRGRADRPAVTTGL